MDVGLVDSYLVTLLTPRFVSMMKHFSPGGIHQDGMETLLRLATIWFTSVHTPATKALGMYVRDDDSLRQVVPRKKVLKLICLSVVLPAVYHQLVSWHERSSQNTTSSDRITRLALERKRQLVSGITDAVKRTVPILRLVTLISCWSGRSNAPGLAMCLAGLSFAQHENQQAPPLNATYAHRRWLYEELLRTIQSVSPYSRSSGFYSLNSW